MEARRHEFDLTIEVWRDHRSGGIFPNQNDSLRISLDLDEYVDVDALIVDIFDDICMPKYETSLSNQIEHSCCWFKRNLNGIRSDRCSIFWFREMALVYLSIVYEIRSL